MATALTAKPYPRYTTPVLSRYVRGLPGKASFTLFAGLLLVVFLTPFGYMTSTAFKNREPIASGIALPVTPATFSYQGKDYNAYAVPYEGAIHQWTLIFVVSQRAYLRGVVFTGVER